MESEGEQYVRETLQAADNSADVVTVLKGQLRVKIELDNDAMDEIKPYLEQGV